MSAALWFTRLSALCPRLSGEMTARGAERGARGAWHEATCCGDAAMA